MQLWVSQHKGCKFQNKLNEAKMFKLLAIHDTAIINVLKEMEQNGG